VTTKRRVVYAKQRGAGGLSSGRGWLKATGAILGVALPLGGLAAWMVKTSTENAIMKATAIVEKANTEMTVKLALLKESVDRSSGQTQLDLASIRNLLGEHGEAIAQLKATQEIERSLHRR
jgi:hypothetical protein